MKKQLLFTFLLLSFAYQAFSQIKTTVQPKAQQIKERELVIVLEPETRPEIKKMNEQLQQAVKDYWDFSDDYIFVNKENVGDIKDTEFAILTFTKFAVNQSKLLGGPPTNTEMSLSVQLSEAFNPKFAACSINLVHTYVMGNTREDFDLIVPEKDIIFGVQRLNKMLWNAYEGHGIFYNEVKDRTASLKEKTLLIDANLLTDKFAEVDIKEIYPHRFKVMTSDQIAEKLKEKSTEYAYLGVVRGVAGSHGETQNFLLSVIDAEKGSTISYTMKPMKYSYELNQKHIKGLLKTDEKYD